MYGTRIVALTMDYKNLSVLSNEMAAIGFVRRITFRNRSKGYVFRLGELTLEPGEEFDIGHDNYADAEGISIPRTESKPTPAALIFIEQEGFTGQRLKRLEVVFHFDIA